MGEARLARRGAYRRDGKPDNRLHRVKCARASRGQGTNGTEARAVSEAFTIGTDLLTRREIQQWIAKNVI